MDGSEGGGLDTEVSSLSSISEDTTLPDKSDSKNPTPDAPDPDEYQFNDNSIDYDVEYFDEAQDQSSLERTSNDESHADPLSESGTSHSAKLSNDDSQADPLSGPGACHSTKRRKTGKYKKQIRDHTFHSELDELLHGSKENDNQYRFKGTVFEKNFKNQKSFERCGDIMVSGSCVEDVMSKVWQFCLKFIYRGVVFPDASNESGDLKWEDPPTFDDRDKFMIFHNKISKRSIIPSLVDGHTLQTWLTKDVSVILYKYSNVVSTLHKWNQVESQLLRSKTVDRAGAESVGSLNDVKEDLKKRHGKYLSADDVNRGCWANWICSKPLTMRDDLMSHTPPQHIIGLFSTVPVHSDVLLEKARLDFQVASTVNKAYVRVLQDLKDDHRQLMNIASVMGQRITMLEEKQNEYDTMLTAMNSSVSARENKFSVELAQSVTDCVDVDHL
ncbi:uncharacterized protein LOC129764522 [Toxorhynchites rutilus septentrionalis]|uniref:uncharacterized protein LOC129764522 n=1 Tax=Toxorhynchites rutilus septentrionalis TaxID=329112 RepID=UPI00247A2B3B|nr:uncharacterized protein LOC129764522 [Toxorhynchites rutilus septentrionalis]